MSVCTGDLRERSAGIIQRSLRRLGFKERNETGLPKMMIRGESIANAELAHDSETDAIGKGPLVVAMLAKPGGGGVKLESHGVSHPTATVSSKTPVPVFATLAASTGTSKLSPAELTTQPKTVPAFEAGSGISG